MTLPESAKELRSATWRPSEPTAPQVTCVWQRKLAWRQLRPDADAVTDPLAVGEASLWSRSSGLSIPALARLSELLE